MSTFFFLFLLLLFFFSFLFVSTGSFDLRCMNLWSFSDTACTSFDPSRGQLLLALTIIHIDTKTDDDGDDVFYMTRSYAPQRCNSVQSSTFSPSFCLSVFLSSLISFFLTIILSSLFILFYCAYYSPFNLVIIHMVLAHL